MPAEPYTIADEITQPQDRWAVRVGLILLSAGTLLFEINLTRLYSVAQFYHFAFMIVSIGLLGYGASGTALVIFPSLSKGASRRKLAWLSLASGLSILCTYLTINHLPFDSFSIAWDRRQIGILVFHYFLLSTPFFFNGLVIAILLSRHGEEIGSNYAANLSGSALGCLAALVTPRIFGGEGIVVLSSSLAALSALCFMLKPAPVTGGNDIRIWRSLRGLVAGLPGWLAILLLFFCLTDSFNRIAGRHSFAWLDLKISPYKGLSYALQYPDVQLISSQWNTTARTDIVRSSSIRSLPGLSYLYPQASPAEDGIFTDGDDLSPIIHPGTQPGFERYLPLAAAFILRPQAQTLILEPRGGLDVFTALALNANRVTAVEMNPAVIRAAQHIYGDPRVQTILDSDRSYIHRLATQPEASNSYDIVILSLISNYHPVQSGAYSLMEDYRYTVEAFGDVLANLDDNGIFAVTRWLQKPPSECLRTFALAITALERSGRSPADKIVAFRGYNLITFLIKKTSFTPAELSQVRDFTAQRAFDLVYAPDIQASETNQYNILPTSVYYQTFQDLIYAPSKEQFYQTYPYDIRPPTDDDPFFGHFFKWSQTRQVIAELGKTWQPFGGAGYFVIVILLILALLLSSILILVPVVILHYRKAKIQSKPGATGMASTPRTTALIYFISIGLAYLLVEIPFIQRFILFLGHPAYAMTAVLFSLLLFSGLGSQFNQRISIRSALFLLILLLVASPYLFTFVFNLSLGFLLPLRLAITVILLSPYGFLMGIPFPGGVRRLLGGGSDFPLIWAANGAASVVASVLAALLALSFGFHWVLQIGALCYGIAWLMAMVASQKELILSLPR